MQELSRKKNEQFYLKRLKKHNDIEASSYIYIKQLCEAYGKKFVAPYKQSKDLSSYILNKDVKELHSPKQKNVMYISYKNELDKYKLYRRNSNLQVNSGLREWHDTLLNSELNKNGYKSVVGIYNTIFKYFFGGYENV